MKLLFDEKLFLGYHNPHGTKKFFGAGLDVQDSMAVCLL
jgi:hypothetical protein